MRRNFELAALLTLVFATVGAFLAVLFVPFLDLLPVGHAHATPPVLEGAEPLRAPARFLPPDPRDAPEDIRKLVLLGHDLVMDTGRHLGGDVNTDLSCASCHFRGGLTRGGRNGGLSLVGSAVRYPRVDLPAQGRPMDLAARINYCLTRSLGAPPLAPESREMLALLTYHHWISKGIALYEEVPWIPIEPLVTRHAPEPSAGEGIFTERCSMCHGRVGQGTPIAPAVWGERSFTQASPMARLPDLSAFVFLNMPRENPVLKEDAAVDVAAFLLSQPRPAP